MTGSSNASFIPKRGSAKRSRKKQKSQVYILTVISYVLLFATLLATAGVFVYGKYIDNQLTTAANDLNAEIDSFSEAKMTEVQVFDQRLRQAKLRLDNSASVASILTSLEEATLETIRFTTFDIQRIGDEHFVIDSSIETDSFDSSLYQRNTYTRTKDVISGILVENLQLQNGLSGEGQTVDSSSDSEFAAVSFNTQITIPVSAVPFDPKAPVTQSVQPDISEISTDTSLEETVDQEEVTDDNQPTS